MASQNNTLIHPVAIDMGIRIKCVQKSIVRVLCVVCCCPIMISMQKKNKKKSSEAKHEYKHEQPPNIEPADDE